MKKLPYLLSIAFLSLSFTACSDDGETETTDAAETTGDGDGDGDATGDGDGDPAGDGDGDSAGDGDGDDSAGDGDGDTAGDGDGDTAGDGDGDTAGDGDGDPEPAECIEVSLEGWTVDENGNLGIEDIMIGNPDLPDLGRIEFYGDVAVGQVDLGSDGENNYAVCIHCVRVFEDIDGMDIARQYFQTGGVIDITEVGAQGEMVATHSGITLVEVTIADDFTSTPVPGGACINVVDGDINTLP